MTLFHNIFGDEKPIIGMVHLQPLPGAPSYADNPEPIYACALNDLKALEAGGATAFMVENFGDIPYGGKNDPMTLAAFAGIAARLRRETGMPMGINVQFNDFLAEWAIAYGAGADFIRVEVFAETRTGANGVFTACGPELMRLKRRFPKEIALLCDLHVKHTFALGEQPTDFTVASIIEGGGDAIIETGLVTGRSPAPAEVRKVKQMAGDFPVLVGSGVNAETAKEYLAISDGVIVGSAFKYDGKVENGVDEARVRQFIEACPMPKERGL